MSERFESAQASQIDGLAELYRRHAGWLRRRLRRRFGDLAEDLAQETWLRAGAAALREARHPRAFLLRAAAHLGADHGRREARRRALLEAAPSSLPTQPPAQVEALLVKEAILALPEPLRDVFLLHRFEGLSYAEIGERLGISPRTAEWRMAQALARCAAGMRS